MSKTAKVFIGTILIVYIAFYTILVVVIDLGRVTFSFMSLSIILIPLLAILYLVTRYILKKDNISKNKTVLILVVSIIFPIICLLQIGLNEYRTQFTVEKWSANSRERTYMVEDFLNQYELIGMNENEVLDLLGQPSKLDNEGNFFYFLGNEKGFIPIDDQILVIFFNNTKSVTGYEVVSD